MKTEVIKKGSEFINPIFKDGIELKKFKLSKGKEVVQATFKFGEKLIEVIKHQRTKDTEDYTNTIHTIMNSNDPEVLDSIKQEHRYHDLYKLANQSIQCLTCIILTKSIVKGTIECFRYKHRSLIHKII